MRRAALALLAAAALPCATAAADEVERSFTIAWHDSEEALRTRIEALLPAWVAELPQRIEPAAWDAAALGPFDVVRDRLRATLRHVGPQLATVHLRLEDSGLPSGGRAIEALGSRAIEALGQRLDDLERSRRLAVAEALSVAEYELRAAEGELAEIERESGDPGSRRANLSERLLRAESDLAETRIARAVAARRLEVARAAADRAVAVGRLEAEFGDAALRVAAERDPERRKVLEARLAELRQAVDEARARSPSLDLVRERVFELEVELVGLESREALLREELAAGRAELPGLRAAARAQERVLELVRARARRVAELRETLSRPAGPGFALVRDLGPVVPNEGR